MIQWNILDWCNHFGEFFFIKQYLLNAFYVPGKLLGMGDIDIDEAYDYIHEINSYVDGNKWGNNRGEIWRDSRGIRDLELIKQATNWAQCLNKESTLNPISNLSKLVDSSVGRRRYKLLFGAGNDMMGWSPFKICWVWDTKQIQVKTAWNCPTGHLNSSLLFLLQIG